MYNINDKVIVINGCDETINNKWINKEIKIINIITENDVGATPTSPYYECVHPILGIEHFWKEELKLING